ncbi:MAG TPA: S41 family peptidase, partial [Dehalococcoidia bacterium]|nr:S41 family peptidase [Dehalococcoidia bacterium]
IAAALAGFEQAGVIGWVLDLRANGGGYAEPITDLFAPPSTTIMRVAARGATPVSLIAGDGEQAPARPLAILIGPGSASAAEIVPEALREDGRAILVGERTPGAMATTEEVRLSDGSSLWITHEHVYVGAAGPDLDGVGVSPDICAPETAADLAAGRDPGLDAAVQALSEEAAPVPTAGR